VERTRSQTRQEKKRCIRLEGVSTNNLKEVEVSLPHGRITAVTGLSGSGKSSLVFDTLYAECQLRYLESLSPYVRQFLEKLRQPRLRRAEGLLPAMALRQRRAVRNSRSTVGTVTGCAEYLRLLFARAGQRHCPECGRELAVYSPAEVAAWCQAQLGGAEVGVLFRPFSAGGPAVAAQRRSGLIRQGFGRVLDGGRYVRLDDLGQAPGQWLVVADRLRVGPEEAGRLLEAVRLACREDVESACRIHLGSEPAGLAWPANVAVQDAGGTSLALFPGRWGCRSCGRAHPPVTESQLSFNNPQGACPTCKGFGEVVRFDPGRYLDPSRTIAQNPVLAWETPAYRKHHLHLVQVARKRGWPLDVPFDRLEAEVRQAVLEGDRAYGGAAGFFRRLERKSYRLPVRVFLSRFRSFGTCPDCGGRRLNRLARSVRLHGRDLGDVSAMTVDGLLFFLRTVPLPPAVLAPVRQVLDELVRRLECLSRMGAGYLGLARGSAPLSGGAAQRAQLAAVVGHRLADTLYILDEPTLGLHPRDQQRLGEVLGQLRDQGNTVVFVEHDPAFIACAEYLVELGPGAGPEGGEVIYQGELAAFVRKGRTSTAAFLRGEARGRVAPAARPARGWLGLQGVRGRNLKGFAARLPLGCLTGIAGVSGSGKSTLLEDVLYPALAAALRGGGPLIDIAAVDGWESLRRVCLVDQGLPSLGRRSTPASYLKFFEELRTLFAALPAARWRGRTPGFFSLNTGEGRCGQCQGRGSTVVDMQFLADEEIPCEACGGTGFGAEALRYRYDGLNIVEVLELSVTEAHSRFDPARLPVTADRLGRLAEFGLGYLRLGQPLGTLSGGEAQRLKLCRALLDPAPGGCLYLLDEPTTGLHPADTRRLLQTVGHLLDQGHTVAVVEHDLYFLENCDWLLELGPGGGDEGGRLLFQGTPEALLAEGETATARALLAWREGLSRG